MEYDIKEKIDSYVEIFDSIREKTDSDDTAVAILQEITKDRRSEEIREEREKKNSELATEKQKNFMKKLGIKYPRTVTKKEASILIDEELEKMNEC